MLSNKHINQNDCEGCNSCNKCGHYPTFKAVCSCCSPGVPEMQRAFGSLYGNLNSILAVQDSPLNFTFAGPVLNTIANSTTNSITVLISGVYEMSADLININPMDDDALYEFRKNNVAILGSQFGSQIIGAGANLITPGRTIQTELVAGDIITIVPLNIIGIPRYSLPSLTVNRISP